MKKMLMITLAMLLAIIPVVALAEGGSAYSIDLTPILQAVFALLGTLITVKLIPWIKSKTTAEQQRALHTAVQIAVYAAEQVYGAGQGKEKLAYAKTYLMGKGYTVDIEVIEAAVREMGEAVKKPPDVA